MVDVPAGDVRDVLRTIADAHGLSVVIPGELTGKVSVRLDGVSYENAYMAILEPMGYAYRQRDGLVIIHRREQPPPASKPGDVIYRVRYRPAAEVAVSLQSLAREQESVQVVGDQVIFHGSPDRQAQVTDILGHIDTPRRQVVVECRFQEVERGSVDRLGLSWSQSMDMTVTPQAVTLGTPPMTAILSLSQLSAVLSLYASDNSARLVSSPRLMARDGEESSVNVGRQYPLPQYRFATETGVLQVSGFEYKDVGVSLKVTPRFVDDGAAVVLDLAPEVSSVVSSTTFGGIGAAELPVIATRSVRTRMQLRDGETVVLSGLVTAESSDITSQVKGLGKIPVLGRLFRSDSSTGKDVELLVFVTVRFLGPAGLAGALPSPALSPSAIPPPSPPTADESRPPSRPPLSPRIRPGS
jgi:type II secretory pathway component GspD/PulD (secretin)